MKFEIEIIKTLQQITSPVFDYFCKFISHSANYIGFAFVLISFFFFVNKKFSLYFGLSYGIGIGTNYLIKFIVNRPRPYLVSSEIQNILPATGSAMASGHTMSATIIACFCLFVIFLRSKKAWVKTLSTILFVLFIGAVVVSRMYLGQHYLTDTLVGFAEGIVFSMIGIFAFVRASKKGGNQNGNNNN